MIISAPSTLFHAFQKPLKSLDVPRSLPRCSALCKSLILFTSTLVCSAPPYPLDASLPLQRGELVTSPRHQLRADRCGAAGRRRRAGRARVMRGHADGVDGGWGFRRHRRPLLEPVWAIPRDAAKLEQKGSAP